MDEQPPSEWDRIGLFQVQGEEFQRTHQVLTLPGLSASMGSDSFQAFYWIQMIQTMFSPKVFATGSAVRLPAIAQAPRACAVRGGENNVEQIATSIEEQFKTRIQDLIDRTSFDDVLCGCLLHADRDRYLRTLALTDDESHLIAFLGNGPVHTAVDLALYEVNVCLQDGWITMRAGLSAQTTS